MINVLLSQMALLIRMVINVLLLLHFIDVLFTNFHFNVYFCSVYSFYCFTNKNFIVTFEAIC